jgi:hypothetical protein
LVKKIIIYKKRKKKKALDHMMLFSVQELHIYIYILMRERIRLQYRAGDMLFVLVSGWIKHPTYLKVREETESGVEHFKCVGCSEECRNITLFGHVGFLLSCRSPVV